MLTPLDVFAQKENIQNPFEMPHVVPPQRDDVDEDEDVLEHDLQQMIKRREQRELEQNPPIPRAVQKQMKLIDEAKKNTDHRVFMQLSLTFPTISAQGGREDYHIDPTTGFGFLWRVSGSKPDSDMQLWVGSRLTAFSGTGTLEGVNARFSFTYFGPALAFGKISPIVTKDSADKKAAKEVAKSTDYPVRSAYFISFGMVGQAREAVLSSPKENVPDEFQSSKFALDGTGLWAEFTFARVYYEAYSANVNLGAQLGEGKTYAWLGFGFGGWY